MKPYTNAMPTFKGQLNDRMVEALIGMMKNVDQFDAKGNWKNARRRDRTRMCCGAAGPGRRP